MNRCNKISIIAIGFVFSITVFQNCSPVKFNKLPEEDTTSAARAPSSVIPSVTSSTTTIVTPTSVTPITNPSTQQLITNKSGPEYICLTDPSQCSPGVPNVLILDTGNVSNALLFTGYGSLTVLEGNGQVTVNSTAQDAVSFNGYSSLTAKNLQVMGDLNIAPTSTINILNNKLLNGSTSKKFKFMADPYNNLPTPDTNGMTKYSYTGSSSGSITLEPGVYTMPVSFSGSPNITFNSGPNNQTGVYVFMNGFTISGQPTLSGNNVTLIIAGGYFSISGGPTLNFIAPTTGIYGPPNTMAPEPDQGIIFLQPRSNTLAASISTNAGTYNLTGALYFPAANLTLSGNIDFLHPVYLITDTLSVSGSVNLLGK